MKKKPDINDFLAGGGDDQIEKKAQMRKIPKEKKQQKIFRLSVDVVNALKLYTTREQIKKGERITETDIVEKLLRDFLKI